VRGNVKKGLKVTKNPYKIFVVGCGRRDGVWGAFFEGGGIILVPAILLLLKAVLVSDVSAYMMLNCAVAHWLFIIRLLSNVRGCHRREVINT